MIINYNGSDNNSKKIKPHDFQPLATYIAPHVELILRKKGGFGADLLKNWSQIVGEATGKICLPFKIQQKKTRGKCHDFQKKSTILFIACEGFSCLKIQHQADEIVKNINIFFGFQAIDKIKIVQKPLHLSPIYGSPARPLNQDEVQWLEKQAGVIENPALRTSIAKLGENIIRTSPFALKKSNI